MLCISLLDTGMAELRHRQITSNMPKSEEKTPLLRQNVPKYQRQPPPVRRPTRALHISISLLILAAFVLYAQKHRIGRQGKSYTVGGQALPEWYAICSKEGRQVYTVPAEGGVGAVEYVVVGGKEVVDTGSLGGALASLVCSELTR